MPLDGFTRVSSDNTAPDRPSWTQIFVGDLGATNLPDEVMCSYAGTCSRRSYNGMIPRSISYACPECRYYFCLAHHHDNPTGRASQYCSSCGIYHPVCIPVTRCPYHASQHCEVPECDDCLESHCGSCGFEEDSPSGYFGSLRPVRLSFPESSAHRLATGERHVGFEIECEDGGNFDLPIDFGITHDGSLSNGIEVLTPPAKGEHLVSTIEETTKVLIASNWGISERCGLHTHIDVRDKKNDLRFLARLFTLGFTFEQVLYNLQEENRHENSYSIPLRKEYGFDAGRGNVSKDFEFIYEKVDKKERWAKMRLREARRDKYGGQRYMGFNFHSVFHRGSLEVRIHEGTLDSNVMLNWAEILQKIVKRAERRLSYKTLLSYLEIDNKVDAIEQAGKLLDLSDDNLSYIAMRYRRHGNEISIPWEQAHPLSRFAWY